MSLVTSVRVRHNKILVKYRHIFGQLFNNLVPEKCGLLQILYTVFQVLETRHIHRTLNKPFSELS